MSRVLVTGASGHLGVALLSRLTSAPHEIVAVVGRASSAERLRSLPFARPPRVVVVDLATDAIAEVAGGDWDAVYHVAAYIPSTRTAEDVERRRLYEVNVRATARLLSAIEGRARHVVFTSSVAVYGGASAGASLREGDPVRPTTFYGGSKLAAEKLVRLWAKSSGTKVAILRVGTIYGPGETIVRALPTFLRQARVGEPIFLAGMGKGRRNYAYVGDVANAAIEASERSLSCLVNLGGDEIFTLRRLAEGVVYQCGNACTIHLLPGAAEHLVLDMAHAHSLGLRCPTPIESGLARQLAWLRAAGSERSDAFHHM